MSTLQNPALHLDVSTKQGSELHQEIIRHVWATGAGAGLDMSTP
jgi:hypothetical protein